MVANNIYSDLTSAKPVRNLDPENIYYDLTSTEPKIVDAIQSHSTRKFIFLTKWWRLPRIQYFEK